MRDECRHPFLVGDLEKTIHAVCEETAPVEERVESPLRVNDHQVRQEVYVLESNGIERCHRHDPTGIAN